MAHRILEDMALGFVLRSGAEIQVHNPIELSADANALQFTERNGRTVSITQSEVAAWWCSGQPPSEIATAMHFQLLGA